MQKALPTGFGAIEIIVGAAIVATIVTAIASAWGYYGKLSAESARVAQADLIAEEGAEVLQYWRDKGWDTYVGNLSTNTTYHIIWNGTDYIATSTPTAVNGSYSRTLRLSPVYRDGSNNIASSGTLDSGTLLATISVNIYPADASGTTTIMQAHTYIHDIFSN